MQQIRRRFTRTVLVPLALLVLIVGGTVPASADTAAPTAPAASFSISIGPLSLNW
jgi:hypothetical protein